MNHYVACVICHIGLIAEAGLFVMKTVNNLCLFPLKRCLYLDENCIDDDFSSTMQKFISLKSNLSRKLSIMYLSHRISFHFAALPFYFTHPLMSLNSEHMLLHSLTTQTKSMKNTKERLYQENQQTLR